MKPSKADQRHRIHRATDLKWMCCFSPQEVGASNDHFD